MDALADLLRALYWEPWQAILTLDLWWANLVIAILLLLKMVFGGWMLAKAGRSPLWVLVLLINGADIVALWVFAYVRWPFVDDARAAPAETPDAD
ncbi:hypothetical protein [Azospirillum sp.]|uniref:hypothetical protein n=1 Tax=Azospirillum sp. TaxID=34012 RepID=UPI003D746736